MWQSIKSFIFKLITVGVDDSLSNPEVKKLRLLNGVIILVGLGLVFILGISKYSFLKQKELMNTEFNYWKGNDIQIDDVLILGVKI